MEVAILYSEATGTSLLQCFAAGVGLFSAEVRPRGADGEIKDGGATEEMATNQLDTYAKKFCLTRKMIINDDLGAFLKVPTSMGNRAAPRSVQSLLYRKTPEFAILFAVPSLCV